MIGGGKVANWENQKTPDELLRTEYDHTATVDVPCYSIRVSYLTEDPDWDAFLLEAAGGHSVQTSLWAQVKAELGWHAVRIIVTRSERIVAGAQLLIHSVPLVGAIGYVPKGPVIAYDDPILTNLVVAKLHEVAKAHRVQYLAVQPPCDIETLTQPLQRWGFQPSPYELAPTATVLIDLTQDLDAIMARMKRGVRYNIRHGLRERIVFREGTESDLPSFYSLFVATSQRQGFPAYPERYYHKMWSALQPRGWIRLFLVECQDEVVSAQLAISFGDTVIRKLSAWAGSYGNYKPNEVLEWGVIRWAKSHGYRCYDFEGINRNLAKRLLRGEPVSDDQLQNAYSFKLGFGGEIRLFASACDYIYNPLLRSIYNVVFRSSGQGTMRSIARSLIRRVRMIQRWDLKRGQ